MTTKTKTRAGESLTPMLAAFHSITDRSLQAVWQVYAESSLEKLILDFGQKSLVVVADENDDSIDISVEDTTGLRSGGIVNGSHREPWTNLLGKRFGWGWMTVNQQGYCDGLLLSFDGIVPQVLLNVIASSIKVGAITGIA